MPVREKDTGWESFKQAWGNLNKGVLKVGIVGSGAGTMHGNYSVAQLAVLHEFGSPSGRVPERSFIRATFLAKSGDWLALAKANIKAVIEGKMKSTQLFGLVGVRAANDMKNGVTSGSLGLEANKPSTIAKKGSDRPLVDTGQLVNAITWVVEGTS